MALLADFLGGIARGVPGMIDDIERREKEEQRRRDIEEERRRQSEELERRYQRDRADRLADTTEARSYAKTTAQEERERTAREREDSVVSLIAARNGVTPEQVRSRMGGGLLQPQADFSAEGGASEADVQKAAKVFAQAHSALAQIKGGTPMASVTKSMDERDERERIDGLTPEQAKREGDIENLRKGRDPKLAEQQLALAQAQTKAAEARAAQRDDGKAGPDDFARTYQVYSNRLTRAEAAEIRAHDALLKAQADAAGAVTKREREALGAVVKARADAFATAQAAARQALQDMTTVEETRAAPRRGTGAAPPAEDEAGPRLDPLAQARAEAMSSGAPVQYDIGGKRGAFTAVSGKQVDGAQALAEARRVLSRRPDLRSEVVRRLTAMGIDTTGL